MKRFISKSEKGRKTKRKQIIIGVSLAFLMILSVLGFALQGGRGGDNSNDGSSNSTIYNGYEFVNQNGLWVLGSFVFRYNPQQVPNIGFGLKDATFYQGKPVYIYSESEEAKLEVFMNLGLVAQRVQNACIESGECSGDIPTKTCEDNFIIIKEGDSSMITQGNNCVYIEGLQEDLTKLTDQFLFKILGIR